MNLKTKTKIMILYILAITATIASFLDSYTTYKALRHGGCYETNAIFSYVFKKIGVLLGCVLTFCLVELIILNLLYSDSNFYYKTILLCLICLFKFAAAHNNYYGKSNFVVDLLLKTPFYNKK